MSFLQDLDPRVAQIVAKVDSYSVGELLNELMDDISFPVIEESREVMFKQATMRYIDILDNSADYSLYDEVPMLVLKNRRKGDQQLKKSSKDLLDLVIYSAALCDNFPKDTLSVNISKFIDIEHKPLDEKNDQSSVEQSTEVMLDNTTVAILTNTIKDQADCIKKLRDDFVVLEQYIKFKLETMGKCTPCTQCGYCNQVAIEPGNQVDSTQILSSTQVVTANIYIYLFRTTWYINMNS